MRQSSRSFLVSGLLCLAACAGDGPEPPDSSSLFARVQKGIFDQSCTAAGCHNPQTAAAGLILTAAFSYDALVGVTPTTPAAAQAGLQLVRPFDPDGSFLLIKLLNPAPGQGSRMPQGAEPLSAGEIQTVREWIEAGAPRFDAATPVEDPTVTPSPTDLPEAATPTPTDPPQAATPTPTEVVDTPTAVPSPDPTAPQPTATAVATVSLEQVQDEIFTPRCAVQFCHSGPFPAAQLDLSDGVSFDEMVNVAPLTPAAADAGMLLVDPGNAENSFLYVKITNPVGAQGFLMPLTGEPLNEQEVALVRAWIESL